MPSIPPLCVATLTLERSKSYVDLSDMRVTTLQKHRGALPSLPSSLPLPLSYQNRRSSAAVRVLFSSEAPTLTSSLLLFLSDGVAVMGSSVLLKRAPRYMMMNSLKIQTDAQLMRQTQIS